MRSPNLPTEALQSVETAVEVLSEHLLLGSLALMTGAGVSASVGLPLWSELVARCRGLVDLEVRPELLDRPTAGELLRAVEEVERACKKQGKSTPDIVQAALYEGKAWSCTPPESDLLRAIANMLTTGRRGVVSDIVTLNFDTALETHLSHRGIPYSSITSWPRLVPADRPRIFHIQGCVPVPGREEEEASDILVFSKRTANKKIGERLNPFQEMFRRVLSDKFVLFVGASELSLRDSVVGSVLQDVEDSLRRQGSTGIWLFGRNIESSDREAFLEANIAPVVLESYEAIPDFLFKVARGAAEMVEA